jgi:NhaP-type Na+/H+ or K+/H+ antiporter
MECGNRGGSEVTIVVLFVVGVLVGVVAGAPGDWARRRAARLHALAQLLNVAAIVATVAIAASVGSVDSFGTAAAMIVGLVLGEIAADQYAERHWGQAGLGP